MGFFKVIVALGWQLLLRGSRASASKRVVCLSLSVRAHAFAFGVSHCCSKCREINSVNYGMSIYMWVVAPQIG